jgi:hypothetical protein
MGITHTRHDLPSPSSATWPFQLVTVFSWFYTVPGGKNSECTLKLATTISLHSHFNIIILPFDAAKCSEFIDPIVSWDSSVSRASGYGLDDRMIGVRFPAGTGNFSLRHRVQTGSGAHPASYPMGTGPLSFGVKRRGQEADHSPPYTTKVKEFVELYLHSPNTFSWRCVELSGGKTLHLHLGK